MPPFEPEIDDLFVPTLFEMMMGMTAEEWDALGVREDAASNDQCPTLI